MAERYYLWLRHTRGGGWHRTRESKLCKTPANAARWSATTVEKCALSSVLYVALPEGEAPKEHSE